MLVLSDGAGEIGPFDIRVVDTSPLAAATAFTKSVMHWWFSTAYDG